MQLDVQLPEAAESVWFLNAQNHGLPAQILSQDPATHRFKVLVRATVPALGYAVLHAERTEDAPKDVVFTASRPPEVLRVDESADTFTMRNDLLQLVLRKKDGCITSLKSFADPIGGAGKEYLAPGACGNQLQTFKDTPKDYDAWNIDPGTLDGTMTPITAVDSIKVVEDGPLRKTIRVTRHWQSSHFTQNISLDAGADSISISSDIDWHETHVLLKAAFPLAATAPKATYEIPYGAIERTTERNNSWEKAKFEVPALRWADLGDEHQGLSILNDSKYGYDAAGNTLRLTLLRSPTWPDPEADRGPQHFTYALYPHAGTWKQALTVHRGYELNDPLTARQVFPHTGTLPPEHSWGSIDNPNVTLTAVKKAEDSDALVYRMYEWAGNASNVTLHVPPGAIYAVESNLMEKPEGPHLQLSGDKVTVPIKPYEILTLQVFYPRKDCCVEIAKPVSN